jgi:predicted GTPase
MYKNTNKNTVKIPDNNGQNIPLNNLNISLIGGVSCGKSTFVNALFCNELAQSSIKRTTMCPTIFIENKELDFDEKEIYNQIKAKNMEIIKETENGYVYDECKELVYNVGKLDINLTDKFLVNIYDIPGLNDARTKTTYYQYLKDNFHKFNIIVFLIDIHSGLNTADEIDMLRLITNSTKEIKNNFNKNVYTLVIVNKADDMQMKTDDTNDTNDINNTNETSGREILYLDDELNEMFEQVNLTVKSEFEKINISEHLIDIIPLCGLDSYLYRMIKKYGSTYELKDADILKIGVNQMGKKFNKKTKINQRSEVLNIIQDLTFVDDMIKLSGFDGFEKSLFNFLNSNHMIKDLLISNLLLDINSYPLLSDIFGNTTDITKLSNQVSFYIQKLDKFKQIDETIYTYYLNNIYKDMNDGIKNFIDNTNNSIHWFKEYYDTISSQIIDKYFNSIKSDELYPEYLKKKIFQDVIDTFTSKKITILMFINNIELCMKSNVLKLKENNIDEGIITIEDILGALMSNFYDKNTFLIKPNEIPLLINNLNIIIFFYLKNKHFMEKFLRFILLNIINNDIDKRDILLKKKMFFDINQEVVMSNYLMFIISSKHTESNILSSKIFIEGFNIKNELSDEYKFEQFYIDFLKKE